MQLDHLTLGEGVMLFCAVIAIGCAILMTLIVLGDYYDAYKERKAREENWRNAYGENNDE